MGPRKGPAPWWRTEGSGNRGIKRRRDGSGRTGMRRKGTSCRVAIAAKISRAKDAACGSGGRVTQESRPREERDIPNVRKLYAKTSSGPFRD